MKQVTHNCDWELIWMKLWSLDIAKSEVRRVKLKKSISNSRLVYSYRVPQTWTFCRLQSGYRIQGAIWYIENQIDESKFWGSWNPISCYYEKRPKPYILCGCAFVDIGLISFPFHSHFNAIAEVANFTAHMNFGCNTKVFLCLWLGLDCHKFRFVRIKLRMQGAAASTRWSTVHRSLFSGAGKPES
jgi:hypothetical protein